MSDQMKVTKVPKLATNAACGIVADTISHFGLSQAEVARAMNVSPGLISDIVKGKKGVSVEFAIRFEKCFGVSSEWLVKTQSFHDYCTTWHKKEAAIASEVKPVEQAV
ncbi:HigA family addiction module antitoxin [Sulfuriroseicoccus oceanibius]|uniref:HigA family addiction module antidote protein n=1 Tax=Sulfuriroseicoccus oceanibius TaxID=2707525 RepID=A0A6B3L9H3_9BACT|nr:HigA family addiction module antitoxin [Sulfuriroseicoccus oceanibius]QQL44194.1 HigA family addiction module antidote protein [Sulfuriroseicoccus oceanibius]